MIKKFLYGGPGYFIDGPKDFDESSKKVASGFNWVMGKVGNVFNSIIAGLAVPTGTSTGANQYTLTSQYKKNLKVQHKAKEKIEDKMVYLSPTSHVAAWLLGSLDPHVGAQFFARDPRLQALGIIGDMAIFKYGPKAVKGVPATVDRGLAAAGNKGAKGRVVAREINKGVKQNTKNGRIEVTEDYFNAPDKWYRITERPEKIGIEEQGKNVTTADSPETLGTINGWRTSILDNSIETGKGVNEGYFVKKPKKINLSLRRVHGRAHGNTSQAAKGQLWQANTAGSNIFPEGIIEGEAPLTIPYGLSRTHFVNTSWEEVPTGGRIGFHTGEMPMSNLGWFLKTNRGTYTYEPIIPEKRITVDVGRKYKLLGSLPRLLDSKTYPLYRGPRFSVNSVVNNDGTINPRLAMTVLHSVADWFGNKAYRMEDRLENSKWHKNDPTTYDHTKLTAQSAWQLPTPSGFTKQDQMIAALGHDFGKMISGEGHAQIGADLARQVFPDLTDALYTAIAEHMGTPTTPLGLITKAADITNGRPFTYLQQYAPGLYSQYLGNTIYRVTQPNSKVRLLLPSHTEAKPREITLEPLGNNKFYAHMRIWDDVDKQVPGKINDVEKNNLFLALYETLPEESEILFPQSGPGFYGTRGTVAGLQRLSRDSRFSPGTPGTLLYLDKDGKTVRTYNSTSFIKKPLPILRVRSRLVTNGNDFWELNIKDWYDERVLSIPDEIKKDLKEEDISLGLDDLFYKNGFTPKHKVNQGKFNEAFGLETIRRLQGFGIKPLSYISVYDGPSRTVHTVQGKITQNAKTPSYMGYFLQEGAPGFYSPFWDVSVVDPTLRISVPDITFHERNMHGSESVLEAAADIPRSVNDMSPEILFNYGPGTTPMKPYILFVNNLVYKKGSSDLLPEIEPLGDSFKYKYHLFADGALDWKEARATIGQVIRNLYMKARKGKSYTSINDIRPEFEKLVDNISDSELGELLYNANDYGKTYLQVGPKVNPNFYKELRALLKYAPVTLPFIFGNNEKE